MVARPGSIEHARYVREARARALEKLEEGTLSLRELLLKPRGILLGVNVYTLLLSPPGFGPKTARRICEAHHIWPLTTLYHLTDLQREVIVQELDERNR